MQTKTSFGKRLLTPVILLFFATVMTVSCKKGDTGPAGTANVAFSAWFTAGSYVKDTVFGIWGYNYTQTAPDITQTILDSGTVITYGKLLGYNVSIWPTTQIGQLPISLTYVQGSTMTDTWTALPSVGKLKIRFVNDKNYWTSIATSHQFRYIIIPGGHKTTGSAARGTLTGQAREFEEVAQHYQEMSYSEVCRRLGIPE